MNEQIEFVKVIVQRLESAGFKYMLTGSLALSIYAHPRFTRDIDLVVEYTADDAKQLAALFENDCYVDESSIRRAADHHGMFNIIQNDPFLKADLIVRKADLWHELEFQRRRQVEIDGTLVYVVTPEDLLLSKVVWALDSESEFQLRDVKLLLESMDNLDWNYINGWSEKLGVRSLLQRVSPE